MPSNTSVGIRTQSPSYQAYQILHFAFVVAPLIAGADKFFHFLVNWDQYVSPLITRILPMSAHTFMLGVGIIEIGAGVLVAFMPTVGGLVVGAWLCGIILNLLSIPGYYDIALRDLGLALGAFALSRLATEFNSRG
jgi:hypothetical protein